MKVMLKCTYLGIKGGQILEMETNTAQNLIRRGVVEEVKDGSNTKQINQGTEKRRDKMIRPQDVKRKANPQDVITEV